MNNIQCIKKINGRILCFTSINLLIRISKKTGKVLHQKIKRGLENKNKIIFKYRQHHKKHNEDIHNDENVTKIKILEQAKAKTSKSKVFTR